MSDNLISGVVSGLVVTLFVVVFQGVWNSIIVPWFEDRVYKDIRVEGTWYGFYPTIVGERPETVTLRRHGHSIYGSIICNAGRDEGKIYRVTGTFRNMILTLFYESEDHKSLDRGAITMRCVHNGERLRGKIANYHDTTDSIMATELIWFRSKEDQERSLRGVRARDEAKVGIRRRSRRVEEDMKELTGETAAAAESKTPIIDTAEQGGGRMARDRGTEGVGGAAADSLDSSSPEDRTAPGDGSLSRQVE